LLISVPGGESTGVQTYFTGLSVVFFLDRGIVYRQALDGSPAEQVLLEGPSPTPLAKRNWDLKVTPNGGHVVTTRLTDSLNHSLIAAPTLGGLAFELTGPANWIEDFDIRGDSNTVVMFGSLDSQAELFVTTITGRTERRLNDPLRRDEKVSEALLETATTNVVYSVYNSDTNTGRLFVVDPIQGSPQAVNPSIGSGQEVDPLATAGTSVLGYLEGDVVSYPISGSGEANRLSASSHRPRDAALTPDGSRAIYRNYKRAIFAVPVTDGSLVRISAPVSSDDDIERFEITADSSTVIYEVRDKKNVRSLFSVDSGLRCMGEFATIVGSDRSSTQTGTPERDVIHSQGGDDVIKGLGGDDVICGGDGDDIINAGSGADRVYGNNGNDIIRGRKGPDIIRGGKGNDSIYGNAGEDTIRGQSGDDKLLGGKGKDTLIGNKGNDTLNGGPGKDTCIGGKGKDTITRC